MDHMFLMILAMMIWTSTVIIAIHFLRKKRKDISWLGIQGIFAIYLFCLARSLEPIDFNLGNWICMPFLLNGFYETLVLKEYHLLTFSFTLEPLLYLLWFVIAAVRITLLFFRYHKVYSLIKKCSACEDGQVLHILEKAKAYCKADPPVIIRTWDVHPVPVTFGIRQKTILLPHKDYGSQELFHVFVHELTHIRNHDLAIKLLLQVWVRFFWWNPIFTLLYRDLTELMELRCDMCAVRQMDRSQKADYLAAILSAIQCTQDKVHLTETTTVSIAASNSDDGILERFQIVSQGAASAKNQKLYRTLTIALTVLSFLLSYLYMPGPEYYPPIEEIETDGYREITTDEMYILHTKDNQYYLVFNNIKDDEPLTEELAIQSVGSGYQIIEEKEDD